MGAGVLMVFAVLVLLFARVFQPITILSALPLSLGRRRARAGAHEQAVLDFGGDRPFDADGHRRQELDPAGRFRDRGDARRQVRGSTAILEAGHKRARPIVMTTVAMVAGMLPVAAGWGGDSDFRSPMAIAVIGGLVTSTALDARHRAGGLHALRRHRALDGAAGEQTSRGTRSCGRGRRRAARARGVRVPRPLTVDLVAQSRTAWASSTRARLGARRKSSNGITASVR